jgi:predicted secreted protein
LRCYLVLNNRIIFHEETGIIPERVVSITIVARLRSRYRHMSHWTISLSGTKHFRAVSWHLNQGNTTKIDIYSGRITLTDKEATGAGGRTFRVWKRRQGRAGRRRNITLRYNNDNNNTRDSFPVFHVSISPAKKFCNHCTASQMQPTISTARYGVTAASYKNKTWETAYLQMEINIKGWKYTARPSALHSLRRKYSDKKNKKIYTRFWETKFKPVMTGQYLLYIYICCKCAMMKQNW